MSQSPGNETGISVLIMCHLLLVLPVLALPLFWILPPAVSIPVYALIVAMSVALYVIIIRAMRSPVLNGKDHVVGAVGTVVDRDGSRLTVSVDAELWTAEAEGADVGLGDAIRIVGMDGLTLRVVKSSPGAYR